MLQHFGFALLSFLLGWLFSRLFIDCSLNRLNRFTFCKFYVFMGCIHHCDWPLPSLQWFICCNILLRSLNTRSYLWVFELNTQSNFHIFEPLQRLQLWSARSIYFKNHLAVARWFYINIDVFISSFFLEDNSDSVIVKMWGLHTCLVPAGK